MVVEKVVKKASWKAENLVGWRVASMVVVMAVMLDD